MQRLLQAESKAEIDANLALEADIRSYAYSINRPYSTMMSAMVFPMGMGFLFLKNWSPFRSSYDSFERSYFDHHKQEADQSFSAVVAELESLQQEYRDVLSYLQGLYFNIFGSRTTGTQESIVNAVIEKFDGSYIASDIKNMVKRNLLALHNNAITHWIPEHPETRKIYFQDEANKYLDKGQLHKYKTPFLFKKVQTAMTEHRKRSKEIISGTVNNIAKIETAFQVGRQLKYAMVTVTMFGQFFLMDMALQRRFPYGINFECQFPCMVYDTQDKKESRVEFASRLGKKARRNIKVARILSVPFLVGSCILLESLESMSPELMVVLLSMMAAGCKDLIKDSWSYYYTQQLSNKIEFANTAVKTILSDINYQINRRPVIGSCSMTVTFERSSRYKVSAEKTARTFVNALSYHHAPMTASHGAKVMFDASFVQQRSLASRGYNRVKRFFRRPVKDQVTEIKDTFQRNIARHSDLVEFKEQIKTLLSAVMRGKRNVFFLQIPRIDASGFSDIVIEFNLPKWMTKIKKDLEELFEDSIIIEEHEFSLGVTLSQYIKIDKVKLKNLVRKINQENGAQDRANAAATVVESKTTPSTSTPTSIDDETPAKEKQPKRKNMPSIPGSVEKKEGEEKEAANELQSLYKLFGVTEEEAKQAPIYPIDNSRVKDMNSFRNSHHFVRCILDEKTANQVVPGVYKVIEGQVQVPSFAGERGEQGFRLWVEEGIPELNGQTSSLKLKLKGQLYGDYRPMAVQKWPPPGVTIPGNRHVLHEIVAVVEDAHKTLGSGKSLKRA
jgi:hypothetical protein